MQLSQTLKQAQADIQTLKKAVGVDKRIINKIDSLVWEAEVLSRSMILPGSLAGVEPSTIPGAETVCICPRGAVDTNCPAKQHYILD